MSIKIEKFAARPFTSKYFNHCRGVAQVKGLTAGEKEGYASDDPTQVAPFIFATSPDPVPMINRKEYQTYHAGVPSRPFYGGEEMPYPINAVRRPMERYYTDFTTPTTAYAIPIGLLLAIGIAVFLIRNPGRR